MTGRPQDIRLRGELSNPFPNRIDTLWLELRKDKHTRTVHPEPS